jgi:peptide-methionine (S)-S-oxide reductase
MSQFSRLSLCAAAIGALAIAAFVAVPTRAAEEAVVIPAPAADLAAADGLQTAVVAGGCFWGVQGVFQHTAGVVNAVSGYAGGSQMSATYEQVSTGTTGHAESVQIKFDPKKISYGKILQIFFSVAHDPSSTARARTPARNIAPLSSPPPTSRRRWRTPISPSSTPPRSMASRS